MSFRAASARLLGPADFGQLTLLSTLLLVTGTIATLGLGNIVPRYLPIFVKEAGEKWKRFLSLSFRIAVVSGVLAGVGLLAAHEGIGWPPGQALWLISLLIPLFVVSELIYAINRGLHQTRRAMAQREVIRRGIPLLPVLMAFLIPEIRSLEAVLLAIGLGLIGSIYFGGRGMLHIINVPANDLPLRGILSFAVPLVLSTVLMQINGRLDVFIAAHNLSAKDLGVYGAALVLPQLLAMLPGVFTFTLLPHAARLFKENEQQQVRVLFMRTTAMLCIFGIVPAGALWIGGSKWLALLFGNKYAAEVPIVEILATASFLLTVCGATGVILLAAGRSRIYLLSDTIAILVGGSAQWWLSIKYGMLGLGYGVIVTAFVITLIRGCAVIRMLGLFNSRH